VQVFERVFSVEPKIKPASSSYGMQSGYMSSKKSAITYTYQGRNLANKYKCFLIFAAVTCKDTPNFRLCECLAGFIFCPKQLTLPRFCVGE
jgi:hypothetical protein